jgi:nucleotide-binding universal stress UspA family protein
VSEALIPPYGDDCAGRVVDAVEAQGVDLAVLPYTAGHSGRLVNDVIARSRSPIVIVPVRAGALVPRRISRILVPLDGTAESAETVSDLVAMFGASGVDILVLHVFDRATVPPMWDQPVHAARSWSEEFLARFCDLPDAHVELRSGVAGEQILDVAAEEQVDLIALGWSQHLTPGRARTVRATLARATIPVLLLPLVSSDPPATHGHPPLAAAPRS